MTKKTETVEEYLARGGQVNQVERGASAISLQQRRNPRSQMRTTYVDKDELPAFQITRKSPEGGS